MQSRRGGFTLAELLIVALIGSIVLGTAYQTIIVQQKAIRQSYAIVGTQQNVRTAMQVLTSDLREISATDADITRADSVSIGYRAMRKAGVVCVSDTTSGTYVVVATIGDAFVAGDSLLVYADGAGTGMTDDRWIQTTVSSVASSTLCPSHPLVSSIQRINFASPATLMVRPGAMVRSFVPVLYRITNVGNEGHLIRGEGPDTVAIVEDLSTIANQGLRFRYWDTARVQISSSALAASQSQRNMLSRIQVKLRGTAVGGSSAVATREFSDSLVTNVYLRGNLKLR
jgi:prepilin-type N-terminal cleavage/methylation domain-containing protein